MELQSGMMLVGYGNIHYLLGTPKGFKVIEKCGSCIPFIQNDYISAYVPENYDDDILIPITGTEIIFK